MAKTQESPAKTMPLLTLSAMVVGSMVGAGVFSLPRNFGQATGGFGALIAWTIAGTGMLMLSFVFQALAIRKPEREQPRGGRTGRRLRLRPQYAHQHRTPQAGNRGHHHRRRGTGPRPRRRALHDLPDHPRCGRLLKPSLTQPDRRVSSPNPVPAAYPAPGTLWRVAGHHQIPQRTILPARCRTGLRPVPPHPRSALYPARAPDAVQQVARTPIRQHMALLAPTLGVLRRVARPPSHPAARGTSRSDTRRASASSSSS